MQATKPTAKRSTWRDYSMRFTQMFPTERPEAIEMYSYDRPAYTFWSAFMNGLMAGGLTEKQAEDWLTSKNARWSLDGDLGDMIETLAFDYAKKAAKAGV